MNTKLVNILRIFFVRNQETNDLTRFKNWRVGVSSAAAWSWGVSLAVGMGIMNTKGILPYIIWAIGNTLAIPLFGFMRAYFGLSKFWPSFTLLVVLMFFVDSFAILINLQGIWTGFGGGVDISSFTFLSKNSATCAVMAIGFFIIWYIRKWGLKISIFSDLGWYTIQIVGVVFIFLAGVIIGSEKNLEWVVINENTNSLEWAKFGFFGIIVGVLGTGHQWQKFSSIKEENILKVSLWGGFFFGVYMLLVGLVGLFFSKNIIIGVGFLITMIALASSTIDSAVAGLEYVLGRFKIKPYVASIYATLIVILWPLAIEVGITGLWTFMAACRLPVVAIFTVLTVIITIANSKKTAEIFRRIYLYLG